MADITSNQQKVLLAMLKNNLEILTTYMDDSAVEIINAELTQYIQTAVSFIEREGITLDLDDISDDMLVTMYGAWMYEKRKDPTAQMPRMLRYNLNNRLFAEKVQE